jgi:hypothetical protein
MNIQFQTNVKRVTFILVASLLLLTLTGCSSTYIDAFNPVIEEFNTAANAVSTQMNALVADNALFNDAAWQSETSTVLSNFKGAAEALTNLPQPEEQYVSLNTLVQEMASQSMLAADAFNAAIEAQDVNMMNEAGSYLDRVNELLPQINAEVDRLNQ